MIRRPIALALLLLAAGPSCDVQRSGPASKLPAPGEVRPGVSGAVPPPADKVVQTQKIYIPVYSSVFTSDTAQPLNLASTLFIRNTDPDRPIILTRADYIGSDGKRIRQFVESGLLIAPLASMDFFIKESDTSGGASPSFLVEWVSLEAVSDPIAEAVMIGTAGTQGISFTCPGRVISSTRQAPPNQ